MERWDLHFSNLKLFMYGLFKLAVFPRSSAALNSILSCLNMCLEFCTSLLQMEIVSGTRSFTTSFTRDTNSH